MFEYSVYSILTGSLLAFVTGTSLTWTSPEIENYNKTDTDSNLLGQITSDEASWIGGIASLGAAVGPFVFGYLADIIGRKFTLLSISLPLCLGYLISAFANKVIELLVARAIIGLGIGGAFTIIPMYIGEMSLDEHRAVLGSGMNSFVCSGLFLTYIVGYFISSVMIFNLFLAGLAAGFFVLFLFIGTETPHYYVQKDKHDLAKKALVMIRDAGEDATEKELEVIRNEIEKEERGTIVDIFKTPGNRKALMIGAGLVFFQQASGINAVLFFAQDIFKQAKTSLEPGYCSMIIGGVQFSTSFMTPILSKPYGRKILLVLSAVGMALSESVLGIYGVLNERNPSAVSSLNFLPIISLVLYIITYNIGYGALPWAVIGEIFPTNVRSSASALATSVCWITSFFITKWFQQISNTLGQGECFLGFAVLSLLAGAFAQFAVLETKGKSLAEIQADLNK